MTPAAAIVAQNKGKDPYERWFTPVAEARDHLGWVLDVTGQLPARVVDPCAGGGAYLTAGREVGLHVDGFDVSPEHPDVVPVPHDRLAQNYDAPWVVTNPPFSLFAVLVRARSANQVLSLLLPVSALGGKKRARTVWKRDPPVAARFVGRIAFDGPAKEMRDEYNRLKAEARGETYTPSNGAMQDYVQALWMEEPRPGGSTSFTWR